MFNMMSGNITTNFVVDNNWYLDLGATHHFTPDYSKLTSATPFTRSDQVAVGDGEKFQFLMLDMLLFQILHILFYLITYVTHLSFQIILSVCPNCVETIRPLLNFILIIFLWRIKTHNILLQGHIDCGLYRVCSLPSSSCQSISPSSSKALIIQTKDTNIWYRCLGYPAIAIVQKVFYICNIQKPRASNFNFCNSCHFAKSHRLLIHLS